MSVKLSTSTAMVLYKHLRREWASGECTAELDAAMRVLDEQLYQRSSMPLRIRLEPLATATRSRAGETLQTPSDSGAS